MAHRQTALYVVLFVGLLEPRMWPGKKVRTLYPLEEPEASVDINAQVYTPLRTLIKIILVISSWIVYEQTMRKT